MRAHLLFVSFFVSFARQSRFASLALMLAICGATWSGAQESNFKQFPKYEIFGGYVAAGQAGDYTDLNFPLAAPGIPSTFSSTHGAEASFLHNFNRVLGLKGDFSVQPHSEGFRVGACTQLPCTPVMVNVAINPKLFNFLAGPELKLRNHSRFTPYVHGLVGLAHGNASLTVSGAFGSVSLKTSETGFAAAMGGGADIRLSHRFSFRSGMDFNPAWVGRDDSGARTAIKNVRLWGGILFH
jgi:opacity protein-like surface antigen